MAEEIVSLGCDSDSEIAYDEDILQVLRQEWELTPVACDSAFDEEIRAILNANNEGLDDPTLFDVCEEESFDMDELMDSEDEEWLLAGARQRAARWQPLIFSGKRAVRLAETMAKWDGHSGSSAATIAAK